MISTCLLNHISFSFQSSISGTDWSQQSSNAKSSTIAFVVISIIWQFIVIYAEVIFVYECKRGIMTAETYAREEQSCFCVSKKQNASSIAKDEKEASQAATANAPIV